MKAQWKQEAMILSNGNLRKDEAFCQLTSDSIGKTLSVMADGVQITIALEQVLSYLKKK